MSTDMAAEDQQKQKREFISHGTQKHQNNTLSNIRTVQIATFPEVSHFFTNMTALLLSSGCERMLSRQLNRNPSREPARFLTTVLGVKFWSYLILSALEVEFFK